MIIKIFTLIISIHGCLSVTNFQLDSQSEGQSEANYGAYPFPGNYTLREVIVTDCIADNVLLSPDQNWVLYQDQEEVYQKTTTFYFRRRRSFETKSIKLGNDKFDFLNGWKFNIQGDLLFIGTSFGFVYMCNFSQNMTNQDCQTRFQFKKMMNAYYSFSINKANQLAVGIRDFFSVLKISEQGELVSVAQKSFSWPGLSVSWHSQHSDIVIIGSCNDFSQKKGFISFFNITSNSSQDRLVPTCVSEMIIFDQENIIITLNSSLVMNAFVYEGTNITPIGISKDVSIRKIRISMNGTLLIGFKNTDLRVQVFTVTKLVSTLPDAGLQANQNFNNNFSSIQLTMIYSQYLSYESLLSFSQDGNQYIISDRYTGQVQVYSMCPRGTYFAAAGCFKCAVNCFTCHITSEICTNCINNTFALFNDSCMSCGVYLTGCLTCLNAHSCLSCDLKNNFSPNPANGSCVCKESHFMSNEKCEPCQPYSACKFCESETSCKECDLDKGFKKTPVNSSCVCRRQFSTVNNTCVECDIEGCERCENVNVCMLCLQSQGYEPDVGMDGKCVKKNSDSLIMNFLIIGGCALIGIAISVYCILRKRKSDAKNELKEEPDFEERSSESSQIHRLSVPKFEEIESMIKQSIEKQIKMEKIPVINKKEYAKISDAQKIQLRHLLKESLLSIR